MMILVLYDNSSKLVLGLMNHSYIHLRHSFGIPLLKFGEILKISLARSLFKRTTNMEFCTEGIFHWNVAVSVLMPTNMLVTPMINDIHVTALRECKHTLVVVMMMMMMTMKSHQFALFFHLMTFRLLRLSSASFLSHVVAVVVGSGIILW
jgi:hypothetical protein